MKALFFVEVVYNREGVLQDPNSQVRKTLRYHTTFIPVWAESKQQCEEKVVAWFEVNKPDYKIIQIINNQAIDG